MDAPAGLTAILNVPDVPKLATFIVDTTVEVDEGTVYSVESELAEGFDCPKTLYVVGMIYAPIKSSSENAAPPPPAMVVDGTA